MSLDPSERRQLLAMMNMATGLQNQIAALLGEDAQTEEPEPPKHPGEVMGRRVFQSHLRAIEGAADESQRQPAVHIPDTAVRTGDRDREERITRPRGSRKRHSG